MGNIVLLDDLTINKIAAGEVIERPASVVKEMVENSIDAGANNITVEIKNGGISYIRITDNGKGIAQDDLEIAFERHATSKIRVAEDLNTVKSMGFRGEALASISAISNVELISKTADQMVGYKIVVQGGDVLSKEEMACQVGTTITVRNLFFNTPVRYKFLKKDFTELGYIEDTITRIALIHPEISIKLINSGKTIIQTNGNGDLKTVVYSIYGKDTSEKVLDVDYKYEDMKVTGVVGKTEIARSNRAYQMFFVNKRYVKDKTLSSAVEQAFRSMLPYGKFPFLVLNLEMDASKVDVNVHPAKLEVRFEDEQAVFKAIYHAIKDSLLKENIVISEPSTNKLNFEKRSVEENNYSNSYKNSENSSISSMEKLKLAIKELQNSYAQVGLKPMMEEPVMESVKTENTIVENPVEETSKKDIWQKLENAKANEPKANEPKANEPKANEPIANEPVTENPVEDEPVVEEIAKSEIKENNIQYAYKEAENKINIIEQIFKEKNGFATSFEEPKVGYKLEEKPYEENKNELSVETTNAENIVNVESLEKSEMHEANAEDVNAENIVNVENSEKNEIYEANIESENSENAVNAVNTINAVNAVNTVNVVNAENERKEIEETKRVEMPKEKVSNFEEMYKKTFGIDIKKVEEEKKQEIKDIEMMNSNLSIFDRIEEYKRPKYKYVGIAFDKYIVIEIDNEMYILDETGAQERVLYESLKKNYYSNSGNINSQLLLLPDIIELSHKDMSIAKENFDIFRKVGFMLEEFGENTIKLSGVPNICVDLETKEMFIELLDEINQVARTAKREVEEKLMQAVAKKVAIKANKASSEEEVKSLMNELIKYPNPFFNPNGEAIVIKMSKYDIERKFSRK